MKKAITILAILAIVAGAVFATDLETHTIKIKADVTEILPKFALAVAASGTATNSGKADVKTTPTNPATNYQVGFTQAQNGEYSDAELATKTNGDALKLDQGGDVAFYAVLQNDAKQIKTYTLTFGGGTFAVKINGHDDTVPASIAVSDFANVDGCAVSANGSTAVDAEFDGKRVLAAASGLNLAKATYTYAAAPNVDMLESGKYYYADVTLTVSTN